jgi:hypothetical protein
MLHLFIFSWMNRSSPKRFQIGLLKGDRCVSRVNARFRFDFILKFFR